MSKPSNLVNSLNGDKSHEKKLKNRLTLHKETE